MHLKTDFLNLENITFGCNFSKCTEILHKSFPKLKYIYHPYVYDTIDVNIFRITGLNKKYIIYNNNLVTLIFP